MVKVSNLTRTKKQLNDYANTFNPNNPIYAAAMVNRRNQLNQYHNVRISK
jgi:hypothetical protein